MSASASTDEASPIARDLVALAALFRTGPPAGIDATQQSALEELEAAVARCKTAFNLYAADRRFTRHKVDLRIVVTRELTREQSLGRGNDLGYGGMAVYVPLELQPGERIHIAFSLPYTRLPFALSAVVRNGASFKYGVAFESVTDLQRLEIDRMCTKLAIPS
jgi:PilZ domain-containing protein